MQFTNMNTHNNFNPQVLCSRKLWQMVNERTSMDVSEAELHDAIAELAARRHYLSELKELGKLQDKP